MTTESQPGYCTITGCHGPSHARGMCLKHYSRWHRLGDAEAEVRPYGDFWAHVDKSGACWFWTGYVHPNGYGQANGASGRGQAHRVAYEDVVGPVPDGLDLDHLCHNEDPDCPRGHGCQHRRCVNPDHLEPVTRSTNMLRANARVDKPEFCSVGGCENARHARGWCVSHYSRWRNHGSTIAIVPLGSADDLAEFARTGPQEHP